MKHFITLLLLLSAASVFSAETKTEIDAEAETETEVETDPLAVFVSGNYFLVGKAPDSNKTFQGKLSINHRDGKLNIIRTINGVTTKGSGSIESALAGETKVLQMKFTENGKQYEETCLVSGDLDNYARISCYLYTADKKTKQPGMEVLFHEPAAE